MPHSSRAAAIHSRDQNPEDGKTGGGGGRVNPRDPSLMTVTQYKTGRPRCSFQARSGLECVGRHSWQPAHPCPSEKKLKVSDGQRRAVVRTSCELWSREAICVRSLSNQSEKVSLEAFESRGVFILVILVLPVLRYDRGSFGQRSVFLWAGMQVLYTRHIRYILFTFNC